MLRCCALAWAIGHSSPPPLLPLVLLPPQDCIYAIDYDTCRSSTGVPFQNCTIPQRPFTESSCYLPGIEVREVLPPWMTGSCPSTPSSPRCPPFSFIALRLTSHSPAVLQVHTHDTSETTLDYCCGFNELRSFKEWVDSNGTGGFVYGHREDDRFVVTEPYLHIKFLDEPSHNGENFCEAPGPGEAPKYNPAALLMTTPLGSDIANVLFTQASLPFVTDVNLLMPAWNKVASFPLLSH